MQQLKSPNWKFALGLPSVVFICCILIVLSPIYKTHKDLLSVAVILDLIISAPLLYYIAIYNTTASKKTVTRVFMIGLLLGGFIIGNNETIFLISIKHWIAPLIEIWVVYSIITTYNNAKKTALSAGITSIDFLPFCREILNNITGSKKMGNIIASEIAVLYYAFSFKKSVAIDNEIRFSYHKKNGILLVLGTVLSLFVIETAGMHFVFGIWSKTVAWVLTLFSAYSCLQLFAHMRSIIARPIHFGENFLELHNGLVGDAIIPYAQIENFELSKKEPIQGSIQKLVLLKGIEGHNCIIHLSETITITRMFGIEKKCNKILFNCDQPKLFEETLKKMRPNHSPH